MSDHNAPTTLSGAHARIRELLDFIESRDHKHSRELREREAAVEAQAYRTRVAEWALVGLAAARVHISQTLNGETDPRYVREVAAHCARSLLHGAKLAFDQHAELDRMLRHIHYLEGHAQSRGLSFRPYSFRLTDDESPPDRTNWREVKPVPFEGPL